MRRDPCVTPGIQLLPPQPLALPLWPPHPPLRGQVASGPPVEKQRGCGTRWRVQSFTTLTSKKNRGLHHYLGAGREGGVKARLALEVMEPHGGCLMMPRPSGLGSTKYPWDTWEYQVSLSPASPPEASSESLTDPDWASSMSKPSNGGGVGSGL